MLKVGKPIQVQVAQDRPLRPLKATHRDGLRLEGHRHLGLKAFFLIAGIVTFAHDVSDLQQGERRPNCQVIAINLTARPCVAVIAAASSSIRPFT